MKHLFKYEEKKGFNEVVGEKTGLNLIRFGLLKLEKGKKTTIESEGYEIAIVMFSGKCDVECEGQVFSGVGGRKDVFSGKPATVYIPKDSKCVIAATTDIEAGVCKVKADKKYAPFIIKPDEINTVHRGVLNWQRDVNDIITGKYEGKVDKIVLGETYNLPGQWSSYPSHKHDKDDMPNESNMEEVLHFRTGPTQGFGLQVIYNDDFSVEETNMIRNGDSVVIKEGYHPVAAAPGYQLYYLWILAGKSGRTLVVKDDPKHAWIKGVEPMMK